MIMPIFITNKKKKYNYMILNMLFVKKHEETMFVLRVSET